MTAIIEMQKQKARQQLEWCMREIPGEEGKLINLNYLVYGVWPPFKETEDQREENAWTHRYHSDWLPAQAWHDRVAIAMTV